LEKSLQRGELITGNRNSIMTKKERQIVLFFHSFHYLCTQNQITNELMKRILLFLMVLTATLNIQAAVDPNFHIYLCFGQSNMEGQAEPQTVDKAYVDPRFQMLACVDFQYTSPKRTMGQWYTAYCPLVRDWTKIGMADYFGRTMVAALPSNVKIGVVDVAIVCR